MQIIHNIKVLEQFINELPDLDNREKYYFSLFARKKYCDDLIKSNDKTQLSRFLCRSKSEIIPKIKNLEGRNWYLKDKLAPQESLVLYIMPNPRSNKKSIQLMAKKCVDLMTNNNWDCNIANEALSCYQQSPSRKVYIDFDIDTDEEIDIKAINEILPWAYDNELRSSYVIWIKTRGGYHLLVNTKKAAESIKKWNSLHEAKKSLNWFGEVTKLYPVEVSGDMLLPVPGTTQGGFVPIIL